MTIEESFREWWSRTHETELAPTHPANLPGAKLQWRVWEDAVKSERERIICSLQRILDASQKMTRNKDSYAADAYQMAINHIRFLAP